MRKSRKTAEPASSRTLPETPKPSWRIKLTERCLGQIGQLPPEERAAVNQALLTVLPAWGFPQAHQGAGIRKLGADLFECQAGLRLRLLTQAAKTEKELIFFVIGDHDEIWRILRGR